MKVILLNRFLSFWVSTWIYYYQHHNHSHIEIVLLSYSNLVMCFVAIKRNLWNNY